MTTVTLPEELERKVLAAAETYALRHSQGVLSNRELKIALDALWQATSGIVEGLTEILFGAAAMEEEPIRSVLINKGSLIIIERQGCLVHARIVGGKNRTTPFDTEADAAAYVPKLKDDLAKAGFTEI